jgi:hypothetical protein
MFGCSCRLFRGPRDKIKTAEYNVILDCFSFSCIYLDRNWFPFPPMPSETYRDRVCSMKTILQISEHERPLIGKVRQLGRIIGRGKFS